MDRYTKPAAMVGALVVVCAAGVVAYWRVYAETRIDESRLYSVARVIDGDTFKAYIGSHEVTVRMLGVNTPETVDPRKPPECYGNEASEETERLLSGHSVRLVDSPGRESRDKYGRYLFYVYRDDGLSVNEALLAGGYAREYTVGRPYSMQKKFRDIEKKARASRKGLWAACEASSP